MTTRIDLARASDISSGVPSGTAFPGSPSTGDLFYRTDRSLIYYYDGTRWLTHQLFVMDFMGGYASTGLSANGTLGRLPSDPTYDMYVVDYTIGTNVASTNNGSNYWSLPLIKETGTTTTVATLDTSADSAGGYGLHTVAVGAVHASVVQWRIGAAKTGAPGVLLAGCRMRYRLVG